MDTSDLRIQFDASGFCNHCNDYLKIKAEYSPDRDTAATRLAQLVGDLKNAGRGAAYDCIIGMSGGVDSSYMASFLCDLGIRPLAVHMDNGWDSEESVSNIRKVVKKLGIGYESYVLNWEEFRDLQLSFLKASVPEAETPTDVAIQGALHRIASKYKIKHIISAGNLATEGILPKSWHYNSKDLKYLTHIHKLYGKKTLKNFPAFDYKIETYFKVVKCIRIIYPMSYMTFSQNEVTNLLIEKFDYKPAAEKHHESRYTRFIQSFYLYEKFGIDYRRAKFSAEIIGGQITREVALTHLTALPYDRVNIEHEKQYIVKKLKISIDDLNAIILSAPKWYWDYPNDDRKLQYIYRTYIKLFAREKLTNFQR